jgi:hypothetical protein
MARIDRISTAQILPKVHLIKQPWEKIKRPEQN